MPTLSAGNRHGHNPFSLELQNCIFVIAFSGRRMIVPHYQFVYRYRLLYEPPGQIRFQFV
jgi:hypothetical protein